MSVLVRMPFYCCLPSDKYIRPCNWGMEGGGAGGVVRESGEGKKKNLGVLRDMAVSLLVTELVAMELVLPLVGGRSNRLTARIVSSLRSFSSLPVSLATPFSSTFLLLSSLFRACTAPLPAHTVERTTTHAFLALGYGCHCQGVSVSLYACSILSLHPNV